MRGKGWPARRRRRRHGQRPPLSPRVLHRLALLRGPTWLLCALARTGARLGLRAHAKVRCGYSYSVARLCGICSAVIGSAAQRVRVRAAAKHRRVPAWACARKQERHIRHLPRAPLYRRAAVGYFRYSHGVLRALTRGILEYSHTHSGTLRTGQGYREYSHLQYTAVRSCRPPPRPSASAAAVPARLQSCVAEANGMCARQAVHAHAHRRGLAAHAVEYCEYSQTRVLTGDPLDTPAECARGP